MRVAAFPAVPGSDRTVRIQGDFVTLFKCRWFYFSFKCFSNTTKGKQHNWPMFASRGFNTEKGKDVFAFPHFLEFNIIDASRFSMNIYQRRLTNKVFAESIVMFA